MAEEKQRPEKENAKDADSEVSGGATTKQEKRWRVLTRMLIPVGLLVFCSGLVAWRIMGEWGNLPKGLLIGGLVVMVACVAININWIGRELARRRTLIGLNVLAMIGLACFVLVVVSVLNVRHYKRYDMTKQKRFGLSTQTINVLKGLKAPLTITTLYSPDSGWLYEVKDLLEEYRYSSDEIKVEHINPIFEKTRTQEFLKRLKLDSVEVNSVVVEYGDRSKVVKNSEMIEESFRSPYNPYAQEPPKFKGEEAITAAIISITEEEKTKLYFTTGHKEKDPDNYDNREGYSEIAKLLKRENYEVEKIDVKKKEIPDDCEVLVIAGPTSPFSEDEIDKIRDYLANEGRVMVMVQPTVLAKRSSGLEGLLSEYGAEVEPNILVLNRVYFLLRGVEVRADIFISGDEEYPHHEITEKMRNERTVFFGACPVESREPDETLGLVSNTIIKTSGKASWGETDFDTPIDKATHDTEVDKAGPLSLAVAIEPKGPEAPGPYGGPPQPIPGAEKPEGPRLVVFGCAEFAANSYAEAPGNQDLFMNSVAWLAAKETKLGIRAKELDIRPIQVSPTATKAILAISIIGLPLLGILLGLGIWIIRRH